MFILLASHHVTASSNVRIVPLAPLDNENWNEKSYKYSPIDIDVTYLSPVSVRNNVGYIVGEHNTCR